MKVSKLFTLDVEVAEHLKQSENASNLVNQLLLEHFSVRSRDKNIEMEQKKKLFQSKIKQINNEIKVNKTLVENKVDQKALNWIRGNYPNIHPIQWRDYCRSRGISIDLSKVMEIIKKNEWVLDKR